jgi:hypothetical protein
MGSDLANLEEHMGALSRGAAALVSTAWQQRARVLGTVGARFMDHSDPLRIQALAQMPGDSGLSREQCARVLRGMARDWTVERLEALVRAEFEDPAVLDGWVGDARVPGGRRLRALPLRSGVGLHICAGTVPGVSVSSLLRGLLVGSPVLLKPGAGDRTLPRLFLEGLSELAESNDVAHALAGACAEWYWRGGVDSVENTALAGAGYVVIYGGTETIADVRRRVATTTPVVAYGHRIGVAIVGAAEAGTGALLAEAIAAFDQRGCVSPQHVFVVGSGTVAERLADGIAQRLSTLGEELPSGALHEGVASAVQQLRGTIELRQAAGELVRVWSGPGVSWTVVLDPTPELKPSSGGRTVHVTPVASSSALESILAPAGPFLQTVGLAGFDGDQHDALADLVGRLGASRVVPLDQVAYPPAWWIHDGQGPLRRLVRWVESGPTPDPAAVPPAR